ncbi:MAG TPA: replication initiator protein A [Armatimonadota bacterium]|nr:replication initiator protein A [Armatimonadota bacterium]
MTPTGDQQKKRSDLVRVGRDEMNLAEFPFALLSKRVPKGMNEIRFADTIRGSSGALVERRWTVTGSPKHGLPVAADELVYVALMEASKEQGFNTRIIQTSRQDIAKRLGLPHGGAAYRQIKASLDRLVGVNIHAENAFWDPDKRSYGTVSFGLIDDYVLLDERKDRTKPLPAGQVAWNRIIFASFQAGNIKRLDTAFFFSLKSPIARRLYRYLDKKRYDGKATFQIGLEKLAFEHLGLSRSYKYPSQIRQKLERGHQELIDRSFLRGVSYEPMVSGGEKVIYEFAKPEKLQLEQPDEPGPNELLIGELTEIGVSEPVARTLTEEYAEDEIRTQMAYLSARQAADPPAVLVQSIREGWAEPVSFREARAVQTRRDEENRQRAEAIHEQRVEERAYEILEGALTLGDQMEIEQIVREELAASNPMVAQRPHSVAYAVAERMSTKRILQERYPIDLERCRAEAQDELNPESL